MGIARQIVNISFLGLDTRTLRIRDWPRGTAIFDVQPKDCNEYLTPRMKLMNAKVTKGSSLRRVDFDFMSDAKSSDKKSSVEDALRKEGFREETPTIWICEELEELVNSEATKISDFVEEICDLMSRESECCGSVKGVDARLRNTIKALFAANGAMCSFTEEENGCVLFSAIKMRRSVREEEYYRNALMDAMEQIDEDGWED
jgi:O-methyltransferase involved in polyketide biosynthesis|tara:strand:- start:102 stop:707 length:606 start_codon:yes stop_codon:yes gene_type:complete